MQRPIHLPHLQVPGDLFVVGDGDCGQFGLGEDVVEAPRPVPTVAGGQKVCPVVFSLLQLLLSLPSEGPVYDHTADTTSSCRWYALCGADRKLPGVQHRSK